MEDPNSDAPGTGGRPPKPQKYVPPAEAAGVTAAMKKAVPEGAVIVSFGPTQLVYHDKVAGYRKVSYKAEKTEGSGKP
jgi:hypothetical protein